MSRAVKVELSEMASASGWLLLPWGVQKNEVLPLWFNPAFDNLRMLIDLLSRIVFGTASMPGLFDKSRQQRTSLLSMIPAITFVSSECKFSPLRSTTAPVFNSGIGRSLPPKVADFIEEFA